MRLNVLLSASVRLIRHKFCLLVADAGTNSVAAEKMVKRKKSSTKVVQQPGYQSHEDMEAGSSTRPTKGKKFGSSTGATEEAADDNDDNPTDSDEGGDPSRLIHESLSTSSKNKNQDRAKTKYAPPDETSERRSARTVFVGNVPVEVAKSRVCSPPFASDHAVLDLD